MTDDSGKPHIYEIEYIVLSEFLITNMDHCPLLVGKVISICVDRKHIFPLFFFKCKYLKKKSCNTTRGDHHLALG